MWSYVSNHCVLFSNILSSIKNNCTADCHLLHHYSYKIRSGKVKESSCTSTASVVDSPTITGSERC